MAPRIASAVASPVSSICVVKPCDWHTLSMAFASLTQPESVPGQLLYLDASTPFNPICSEKPCTMAASLELIGGNADDSTVVEIPVAPSHRDRRAGLGLDQRVLQGLMREIRRDRQRERHVGGFSFRQIGGLNVAGGLLGRPSAPTPDPVVGAIS